MEFKNKCPELLPEVTVKADGPLFNHVFPQQEHGSEAFEQCPPTLRHRRADFLECDEYPISAKLRRRHPGGHPCPARILQAP